MGILYLEFYIRATIAKIPTIHVTSPGIHPSRLNLHCWAHRDSFALRNGGLRGAAWPPVRHSGVQCPLGCVRSCPWEAVPVSQVKERFLGTRNA